MSDDTSTADAAERQAVFLRKLAHEMRTPLGSMLMLAELLADNASGRLGEREVEYARKIQRAGSEISKLLAAVLDLARIETGAVAVERTEVAVADCVGELRQIAEEASVKLAVELGAGLPATLVTDRLQLKRLLGHLLDHAARAGDRCVDLHIAAAGPAIEFAVSHRGAPIAETLRPAAFEPFQPGQRGEASLGLPIAKALAGLLGGRLDLDADGRSFILSLPLVAALPR